MPSRNLFGIVVFFNEMFDARPDAFFPKKICLKPVLESISNSNFAKSKLVPTLFLWCVFCRFELDTLFPTYTLLGKFVCRAFSQLLRQRWVWQPAYIFLKSRKPYNTSLKKYNKSGLTFSLTLRLLFFFFDIFWGKDGFDNQRKFSEKLANRAIHPSKTAMFLGLSLDSLWIGFPGLALLNLWGKDGFDNQRKFS